MLEITPEDLLAGSQAVFDVTIPPEILRPAHPNRSDDGPLVVQLRPITIGSLQLILRAAKTDSTLIPLLLIKEALVQPVLHLEQIKRLHVGLVQFLVDHIRQISGMTEKKTPQT